tara:strand:+ start:5435 stop:6685 length:1251 start_codon:yes stop_codon:yes gene_type:complete
VERGRLRQDTDDHRVGGGYSIFGLAESAADERNAVQPGLARALILLRPAGNRSKDDGFAVREIAGDRIGVLRHVQNLSRCGRLQRAQRAELEIQFEVYIVGCRKHRLEVQRQAGFGRVLFGIPRGIEEDGLVRSLVNFGFLADRGDHRRRRIHIYAAIHILRREAHGIFDFGDRKRQFTQYTDGGLSGFLLPFLRARRSELNRQIVEEVGSPRFGIRGIAANEIDIRNDVEVAADVVPGVFIACQAFLSLCVVGFVRNGRDRAGIGRVARQIDGADEAAGRVVVLCMRGLHGIEKGTGDDFVAILQRRHGGQCPVCAAVVDQRGVQKGDLCRSEISQGHLGNAESYVGWRIILGEACRARKGRASKDVLVDRKAVVFQQLKTVCEMPVPVMPQILKRYGPVFNAGQPAKTPGKHDA